MQIKINEEIMNYLQEKYLECEGLKNVLLIISQSENKYNENYVDIYIEKYLNLYKETEFIKNEIIDNLDYDFQNKKISFDFKNNFLICEDI